MSEVFPLGEVVRPNRPRVKPESMPDAPFIGMEHVEAHTMKLLGSVPAATMKSSAIHFKPGDVLYGRLRPYLNKVFRATFEGLCSAEFIVFPENERIDGRYLQYFLNSGSFVRFATHLNAGDRPRVDFDQIAPYKIPVPSLAHQREIVAELEKQFSRLDEAVANLQRVKANLKRYKASVLKAAVEGRLVETEATLARREGRTYETGEQLLQRILEARRVKSKGSSMLGVAPPLGEMPSIPEGWVWTSLGQCFRVAVGATPSRKEATYWNGDVPWVSSGEVKLGRIRHTEEHISAAGLANSSTRINPAGSVMIGMIGQGRTRGQAAILDIDAANNQNCAAIWVSHTDVPPEFVFNWLLSRYTETRSEGSGNNQQALNKRLVEQIPLPLPPLAEQVRIVVEVDRHLSIIREVEAEVDANHQRAQALRQSILQRSFSTGRHD